MRQLTLNARSELALMLHNLTLGSAVLARRDAGGHGSPLLVRATRTGAP